MFTEPVSLDSVLSSEEAAPPLGSLKPETLPSPVTSSRSDSSLTSSLIASCTTFTFYIFLFLGRVLDLGLFPRGWESSGRLLQGCRWIWSIWNMKQNKPVSGYHPGIMYLYLYDALFYQSCVGGVSWIINESEWNQKGIFFFPPPFPCSSGYILLMQICSGRTHQARPEETIFEFPFTSS